MLTISVCLHLLVLLALLGAGDSREVPGTLHLHHHEAVPVIHLTEEQYSGKASVDDYLKMFPNELLGNFLVRGSEQKDFHKHLFQLLTRE